MTAFIIFCFLRTFNISVNCLNLVGVQGFEPWTPWSQTRCATGLRYTPKTEIIPFHDISVNTSLQIIIIYLRDQFTKAISPMTHRTLQIVSAIILTGLMTFAAIPINTQAQNTRAAAPPSLREPALDQLAAPVALYPDALLAQLLMASTYPLDVAEAARWTARHPSPTAAEIAAQRWESSVKALLPFAPILTMLDKEKIWTRPLAAAVIKQPDVLLQSIQALRERAYENGALPASTGGDARQQQVQRQDRIVTIEPTERRTLYIPYYDPAKVYGAAPNSLLPPEYWATQPYTAPQNKAGGIVFSRGVAVRDRSFYDARIDWRRSRLTTSGASITANSASAGSQEWRHNPQYRKRKPGKSAGATAAPGNNGYTVGTQAPNSATSVGTRDIDADRSAPAPASGGYRISTQPRRANGM
jgi:hypothetical protein